MSETSNIRVKPVFLVGLPRSGSTLWRNVIAQDKSIFTFSEMHYLTPGRKDFRYFLRKSAGDLSHDRNIAKLVDALMREGRREGLSGGFWIQLRRVEPDRLASRLYERIKASDRSLKSIFSILIEEPTLVRGYDKCLVKFPVYLTHTRLLYEWYPAAPVMHITRDPRAMAASKTNDPNPGWMVHRLQRQPWLKFPLRLAMESFVVAQYRLSGRMHVNSVSNVNYRLFRYEDLLADPEGTVKGLCEFAGLEYSTKMLEPDAGQPSSLTGVRRGGLDISGVARWKNVLSPLEVKLITWLTSNACVRLGFDPDRHPVYTRS